MYESITVQNLYYIPFFPSQLSNPMLLVMRCSRVLPKSGPLSPSRMLPIVSPVQTIYCSVDFCIALAYTQTPDPQTARYRIQMALSLSIGNKDLLDIVILFGVW